MLLLPRELNLPVFRHMKSVRITNSKLATDYMLFWLKENKSPEIDRFLGMLKK
jgi:hypothetical protein